MQATQLWQAVLNDLQSRLPKNHFEHWLRPTVIVSYDDDHAVIAASNTFAASTLQNRYQKVIAQALSDTTGRPTTVAFVVATSEIESRLRQSADRGDVADDPEPAPAPPGRTQRRPSSRNTRAIGPRSRGSERPTTESPVQRHQATLSAPPAHGLNPQYTFETYVVGRSNSFAHAAAGAVADQPGVKYNPFYVYGGVGLGKTHLMQAIGHKVLEERPETVIRYVTSERFTNDLINALRARTDMEEFRAHYRQIDILMIDDVQFIAGKEATMEEFFHTFNSLREAGKQVIITSDKPPKAIGGLEERLRSRFEGGLMADVQAPDYEMRIAILRTKSEERGISVPDDVLEYVASRDQTNSRELEGAFNKIVALAELTNRPITLNLAMESLNTAVTQARRARLGPERIIEIVADHFNVTVRDLMSKTRTKEIVVPRQVAMYLIRSETDASLVEIGRTMGRDHTTIMHGINKVEDDLKNDSGLRSQLMSIREVMYTASR